MKLVFRMVGCICLAAMLAGCHAPSDGNAQMPAIKLALYHVPVDRSKAIAGNLESVLESSEFLLGRKAHTEMRVTQPFPGTVLVLAPAALQPSIANAIDEMTKASGKQASSAPESVPLRVQLWVVQAKAGTGEDAAVLDPLKGTLKEIRSSLGPSHFSLEDTATALVDATTQSDVTAGNGGMTTARGHKLSFHAIASPSGKVTLQVQYADVRMNSGDLDYSIPQLHTTITVDPGSYVVLAQAPPPANPAAKAANATLMNLLVVRVDRVEATER